MNKQPKKLSRRAQRRQVERSTRECLFCGSTDNLTEEHVFGDWLQRLGFSGPGLRQMIEDADLQQRVLETGNPFNKRLRIVCRACNGGWMSRLEETAKLLLIDMFNQSGQVRLDADTQLILARWAFKTAAVLSQLGSVKTFPLAHCRELYNTGNPPADAQIWIGSAAVSNTPQGQHLAEWRYDPRKTDLTFSGQTVPVFCYSARFRLINVVFEFFGHVPASGFSLRADLSPDLRRTLLPIWLSEEPTIWWPPVQSLDTIGGVQGLSSAPLTGITTFLSPSE